MGARGVALEILRARMRADAPRREAMILRIVIVLSNTMVLFSIVLQYALHHRGPGFMRLGLMVGFDLYALLALTAIRRGFYHPAIAWLHMLLEVSSPLVPLHEIFRHYGAEYANAISIHLIWACLVVVSALRGSRLLALVAGAIAATESLLYFYLVLLPHLPSNVLAPLGVGGAYARAFGLFGCGATAAFIAHFLLRKAEEALVEVRAQDLMGKYFLRERLGAGGMAEVFRAVYSPEGGFEKVVAIKRVLPEWSRDASFTERFLAEARIGSMLAHPNIVQVLDVGRFEGRYILAMEFVDGVPLQSVLAARAGRPLPLTAATYVFAELAGALDYIHRRVGDDGRPLALVHRDVNPPNILLSRAGEVKLADFGVAIASANPERHGAAGKVGYMAPEQLANGPLDARTDLFALGVCLHEVLTGRRLFKDVDDLVVLERALAEGVPPPSASRRDVPRELDQLVASLLERDPARRPARAREVRQVLLAQTGEAAPYPAGGERLAGAVAEARSEKPAPLDATLPATPGARA